ncbi:unnamed protein product [Danaus chrysippus]|uniref:(African queen) hypothetical protein n=1 Tax=Danaus chrysippus TaxID=151541 RepID=A0A8J2QUB7_9NEOP|nr:unnamed protein product [Danaus chrysippus]
MPLLRSLACGFDGKNRPMICCPFGFEKTGGLSLLPNTDVCGIQNDDRIIGGHQTDLDEHPWTVLLKYSHPRGFTFKCGGVLISSRYVLTAAHCVQNLQLYQVRVGEFNLVNKTDCVQDDCSPDPLDINIEEIIPHEDFKPDREKLNDIALLRLAQEVTFNDFVKPICLPIDPTLKNNNFEGYDMEVAGWGKTETKSSSEIKMKLRVRVRNTKVCKDIYRQIDEKISENHICAGGINGQDSCEGDSGGALMGRVDADNNWMAIGVVSFGPTPCGVAGWPGVYTRVTAYIDWIVSKLRP